jgi:hypothetical protein
MDVEKFEDNIGKKCKKRPLDDKNVGRYKLKPFKSGFKVNTIAGVINHPKLEGRMAYTFEEDESYVECRRCEVIKPKIKIKTKDEVLESKPLRPKGLWWRCLASNFISFSAMIIPCYVMAIFLFAFDMQDSAEMAVILNLVIAFMFSLIMSDNLGPLFSDRYLKIHYYKKRKKIWDKWWSQTARHISYLEYKKTLEEYEE